MKRKGLLWKIPLGIIILLILIIGGTILFISEPRPEGPEGAEADSMARQMFSAVNKTAWDTTGAVSWIFGGSARHEHLWDKDRHLSRVRWDDYEVFVNINPQTGVAFKGGIQLSGEEAAQLVNKAWEFWVNDAFWLNPVVKAFDPGTSRHLITLDDGRTGVMVSYASGGATPGDAYLWIPDENGLPEAWKMWVSIIPIGGLEVKWADWITLPTGAKIATSHTIGSVNIRIEEVKAAATLSELEPGLDPFAVLF